MTRAASVRSIRRDAWPLADRMALEQAMTSDDDGSGECGGAVHLRQPTLDSYVQTYGQWLDHLARTGELRDAEGPAERATPERVAGWRRENSARRLEPTTRRQMLSNLAAILRLMAPDRDWRFIVRPGGRSLKRAIRGGPKPTVVRDVAEVMAHVRRLHRQGLEAPDGPERWRALRDAALLAMLATRAPRVGSLVVMTLDRHITLRPDRTWFVVYPFEHTKGGKVLDYPLAPEPSAMLTDYLENARARFPRAGSTDRLWMGMKGPMTREGLQRIVECRTLAWFGQAHGPHAFRKWLRTSAARRDPGLAMDAGDVMGHTAEVSAQHYAEATNLHAALRHGDRLAERRARHAGRAERAFAAELVRWEDGQV